MGVLDDGEWKPDADREDYPHDSFDGRVRDDPDAAFPAEADRYHLYVSRACPWAHRAALTRRLAGLDEAVSMDVVDPVRRDQGWEFTPGKDGCTADSVHGADRLYEVFQRTDPSYTGPVTVPVLVDSETGDIVNEESADIARMLATEFSEHSRTGRDLYPASRRGEIDDAIDDIHATVNTGVYRAGFADSQADYEAAVEELFDALNRWDDHLADQRYVVGDRLTLADVVLFPTLYRFDSVYYTHFKCNLARLVDFDHLWDYARDIYQTGVPETTPAERAGSDSESAVAATCNTAHVKDHYYRSHTDINPTEFVPVGPELDWTAPHGRAALGGE